MPPLSLPEEQEQRVIPIRWPLPSSCKLSTTSLPRRSCRLPTSTSARWYGSPSAPSPVTTTVRALPSVASPSRLVRTASVSSTASMSRLCSRISSSATATSSPTDGAASSAAQTVTGKPKADSSATATSTTPPSREQNGSVPSLACQEAPLKTVMPSTSM